ncbi:MAG: hypothetical protein H0U75_07665 [Legionella sp.]|nr:hypothetical protein [Legionella sp.]
MRNPYKNFKYEDFLGRPSAQHRHLIDTICQKLFEKFKITYFLYQRRYKNFILLELTNSHHWAVRYCTEYIYYDNFRNNLVENKDYYVWGIDSSSQKEKDMHEERQEVYKIPAGVTFIVDKGVFKDTYSFSGGLSQNDAVYSLLKMKKELIDFGDAFSAQLHFLLKEKAITTDTFNPKMVEIKHQKTDFKPKEIKILSLLAADYDTPQIAEFIHLEPKSVQKMINVLREKMDCETRAGLISKAISENIITEVSYGTNSPIILL